MSRGIQSIAMVDTDGGYGIGGYTYELSEGLASHGICVDVYANGRSTLRDVPPRHHRRLPVLGRALCRQTGLPHEGVSWVEPSSNGTASAGTPGGATAAKSRLRGWIRHGLLAVEFASYLKHKHYDVVWIQWPGDVYGAALYSMCRALGMRVVHTVHNVLPHETIAADIPNQALLYRKADALIVHSAWAERELTRLFRDVSHKIVRSRIGLYTMYPRRPDSRPQTRAALRVDDGTPVVLFFGGIRPYKNVDAVLGAMRDERLRTAVLVVAGVESGYDARVPGDPLGRTRALVDQLGITERVRLVPGGLDCADTTALLEAADILVLPYVKSYGSALLLLGMTFDKYIVATTAGGMDEYLDAYPHHTVIACSDVEHVVAGLAEALRRLPLRQMIPAPPMPALAWSDIAKQVLAALNVHLAFLPAGSPV